MSDLRVRWSPVHQPGHPDAGKPTRRVRGRVVHWFQVHAGAKVMALVQQDGDGSFVEALADNLVADTPVPVADTPVPVADTPVPVADTPVPVADTPDTDAVARLQQYLTESGLADGDTAVGKHVADRAIELLRAFVTELMDLGTARDAALSREQAAGEEIGRLTAELATAQKLLDESKPARRGGRSRGSEPLG